MTKTKTTNPEANYDLSHCPNRKVGLNGDADNSMSCLLTGKPDLDSKGFGYDPCAFQGKDYRRCKTMIASKENIEKKIESCDITVKAGPGGDGEGDVYCWVDSPIPSWAKSVDDPFYKSLTGAASKCAMDIVRKNGRHITFSFSYRVNANK